MTEITPPAIKPVFVVGGLYSLANGVAWIMRDLAAALGRLGAPVTVCGAECWGRGAQSIGHIFESPTRWISSRGLWLGGLSWSPPLKRKMGEIIAEGDVVHVHSLWMFPNSYGSRIAVRRDKPVVITAHGALEPWALANSKWKKRLVGQLFQSRDLKRANCIHVNSRAEAEGVRRLGLRCPIAVIPNGIHMADFESLPPRENFSRRFPATTGKHILLFMARLHEKKGLGHLIPAWANVARDHVDWHLVIAGPDSGFLSTAEKLVKSSRVAGQVTFTGGLQGDAKMAALASADIFVQPSFSEGFSMSVLEAMACRLPVLISRGCNFPQISDVGAGMCVEPTISETETGLRQLIAASTEKRCQMGERGRTLISKSYTWDHVARSTLSLYDWLINGGSPPDCVLECH